MGDLTVEAVDELRPEAGVNAPEYVLYGGKGGVGKTTMAAATGLQSARDGTPTLVVSTDPAHSLSDTFEVDVPAEPIRIREDVPLFAVEIDPGSAVSDGPLGTGGGLGGLDRLLEGGPLGASEAPAGAGAKPGSPDEDSDLLGSMPGADEAAAIRLLLEYVDDDRFERVVVDTAPTGHTLRLLELPEAMDSLLGTVLTLRERLSGLLDGMSGLFGDDATEADARDLDELRQRLERLGTLLRDPDRTDFRLVMVPEELSVLESERLLARLDSFDIPVRTVVVNRVMQDLSEVLDGEVPEGYVGPNHADCAFCARRWDVQQEALARAQEVFRGHDVRRVPLFADEVRGIDRLHLVAACLS